MNFKAGMFQYALAFLPGVVLVQQLAVLPGYSILWLLSVFVLMSFVWLYFIYRNDKNRQKPPVIKIVFTLIMSFILLNIISILYSLYCSKIQLAHRLDESMTTQDIIINGYISNIPVTTQTLQRFEFRVLSHRFPGKKYQQQAALNFPEKVRLSWYYGRPVNAGEQWQLTVRLKPPHGFLNPGGFDYEAWLFQHGIHATGYVRKSEHNQAMADLSPYNLMASVNRIRQQLSRKIDDIAGVHNTDNTIYKKPAYKNNAKNVSGSANAGSGAGIDIEDKDEDNSYALVKALALGDKSSISNRQWHILTSTGTSHLMAISGLHIGLASLFAYIVIRRIVPVAVMKRVPAQHIALAGGLVAAVLYALIAGLSIPTQRALIMLFVLSTMLLIRRNHRPVDALGCALVVVLLFDPLAVLSAGFWFSFSAVAIIFISLNPGGDKGVQAGKYEFLFKITAILKQWVRLQLLISLFLLPLSLFMFQQVSLVSPVVNLLLIPYVSFLVVPVVLLAIVCSFLFHGATDVLFSLAATLLDFVWPLLAGVSAQPYALWVQGEVGIVKLLSATLAALLLFYSINISEYFAARLKITGNAMSTCSAVWGVRFIALILFVPLFWLKPSAIKAGELQLTVLDVGQGSAAVVQTKNHVLVFDTGAKFSDRMDAGSAVVIPYLRSQGIDKLDLLIVSHGDNDHIGGAQAILNEYPETAINGRDIEALKAVKRQLCYAGQVWQWDGVLFSFISPARVSPVPGDLSLVKKDSQNDHSCVLRVEAKSASLMLTGDIEKKAEKQLLISKQSLASDILIVPHHGSNTSSTPSFIEAVNPEIAIFSVGYKNRYRHPSSKVVSRYGAKKTRIIRTDKSGAITLKLSTADGIQVESYREKALKYWHHRVD